MFFLCSRSNYNSPSLRRRANARNVSTSLLPYDGITYLINSFDYPNLLNCQMRVVSYVGVLFTFDLTKGKTYNYVPEGRNKSGLWSLKQREYQWWTGFIVWFGAPIILMSIAVRS